MKNSSELESSLCPIILRAAENYLELINNVFIEYGTFLLVDCEEFVLLLRKRFDLFIIILFCDDIVGLITRIAVVLFFPPLVDWLASLSESL